MFKVDNCRTTASTENKLCKRQPASAKEKPPVWFSQKLAREWRKTKNRKDRERKEEYFCDTLALLLQAHLLG